MQINYALHLIASPTWSICLVKPPPSSFQPFIQITLFPPPPPSFYLFKISVSKTYKSFVQIKYLLDAAAQYLGVWSDGQGILQNEAEVQQACLVILRVGRELEQLRTADHFL